MSIAHEITFQFLMMVHHSHAEFKILNVGICFQFIYLNIYALKVGQLIVIGLDATGKGIQTGICPIRDSPVIQPYSTNQLFFYEVYLYSIYFSVTSGQLKFVFYFFCAFLLRTHPPQKYTIKLILQKPQLRNACFFHHQRMFSHLCSFFIFTLTAFVKR